MLSLLACGIGRRCVVVKIIHLSINTATTLSLAANQIKNLKCALAMLDYSSEAVIVTKPFHTGVYMGVIYTLFHVPSKRLVLSSSMLTISAAWSKLHLHLLDSRETLSNGVWRVRKFPWIKEAAVACTRNISYQQCKFFIAWHWNLRSEHLWCSALCWRNRGMAFSGKTKKSELGTLSVFKAGVLKEGFSGFSS